MLGAIDWASLELVGAFATGAILATIAVLRVVRAVALMFGGEVRRSRRAPPSPQDRGDDDES